MQQAALPASLLNRALKVRFRATRPAAVGRVQLLVKAKAAAREP